MTYKSFMTYIDGDDASQERLSAAAGLTRQFDGHLTVAAVGYNPNVPAYAYGEVAGAVMADLYATAQADSDQRVEIAEACIAKEGILGDAIPVVSGFGTLARDLGKHAQFSDLVVLSQPYGKGAASTAADAFEGAIFDGDGTVLVCPAGTRTVAPKKVMIAWNETRECLRAVRRAMPFLASADDVEILMIDPGTPGLEPGRGLATLLSRHGIHAEIAVQPRAEISVGKAILRHAEETGAGLLVMGGYGHSRFREYVLGGVTREILGDLPIPVLMAH